jgi:alpha-beta hydrolase superfamily lysophospholipase
MGILTNRRRPMPTPAGPSELGRHDGLSYALWLPDGEPSGSVVVLHGAGSCKESHFDFARAARAHGMAALTFDQRGHGESDGAMGEDVLEDVAGMAELLPPGPIALRGSSMGGYLALVAAERIGAAAVVAICPAGSDHLLRALRADEHEFRADEPALARFLERHSALDAAAALRAPLLILHAEGDERIPYTHSEELHVAAGSEQKRLLVVPGGHHRSIQHDAELQGEGLRFIGRAFAARSADR